MSPQQAQPTIMESIGSVLEMTNSAQKRWQSIEYSSHASLAVVLQAAKNAREAAFRLDTLIRIAELECSISDYNRRIRDVQSSRDSTQSEIDNLTKLLEA